MQQIVRRLCVLGSCAATIVGGVLSVGMVSAAEDTFTDETLTYRKIQGGVEITDCIESTIELIIPKTIDGYPIVGIADSAFADCTALQSIEIRGDVTAIGKGAFTGCTALTSVTLPETLTSIGSAAFYYCSSLSELTIPDSVTELGDYALAYCFSLTSVELPDGLKTLGGALFYYDICLETVALPAQLETICSLCFVGCHSLKSLALPASLTDFQSMAVLACAGLKEITVETGNEAYVQGQDGALYTKDGTKLVLYPAGNGVKDCTLPEGITELEEYAFAGSMSLETIAMPESYRGQVFPDGVFSDCVSLRTVFCDASALSTVSSSVFAGCQSLKEITLPENCAGIGEYAFFECKSLTQLEIPETVKYIGGYAFCDCDELKSLRLPETVQEIGEYAIGYTSPAEDAAEDAVPLVRDDFVLHGVSDSAAKSYAKTNGVKFKQDDFDFKWIFIGATVGFLLVLTVVLVQHHRRTMLVAASAPPVLPPEEIDDSGYESILGDEESDPYDRSDGFTSEDDETDA